MAFQNKTDYCGLATTFSSALAVKDAAINGSVSKYQPQGADGSYIATEVYGDDSAPSNNYGVKANLTATANTLKLGKITSVSDKPYCLESVAITTSAGAAPTVKATCQEVETGATDANACHYSIPAFSLTTKQHAQDVFSAFTLGGNGCHLTACSATIACSVGKAKVAGTKVASDISAGIITISGTVIQTGDTAPTLSAETGWIITKPIAGTESNGETSYKTFTFEIQKTLAKDVANSSL